MLLWQRFSDKRSSGLDWKQLEWVKLVTWKFHLCTRRWSFFFFFQKHHSVIASITIYYGVENTGFGVCLAVLCFQGTKTHPGQPSNKMWHFHLTQDCMNTSLVFTSITKKIGVVWVNFEVYCVNAEHSAFSLLWLWLYSIKWHVAE